MVTVLFGMVSSHIERRVEVKEDTSNTEEEKELVEMRYLKKTDKPGQEKRVDKCKKRLKAAFEAVEKAESDAALREEMKEIALGTSKLNYLDPRITVQWCTTHGVPLEKVEVFCLSLHLQGGFF